MPKTKSLDQLFERRESLDTDRHNALGVVDDDIYALLETQWNDWLRLEDAVARLESKPDGYQFDRSGDIEAWIRFDASDVAERERPYFSDYMSESCIQVEFEQDCLTRSEGLSIVIQEPERRRSNVPYVYDQDTRKEVPLDDFTDVDGDIDEELLAHLLELYMVSTGCFPGIFYADLHGNVSLFETVERAKAYRARPVVVVVEDEDTEA